MRYFEDYVPGEFKFFSGEYIVTEDEIIEVGQRWDPQPFHIDKKASEESLFGGLVASSVHLFAMSVNLGNKVAANERCAALSALGFNHVKLHTPARPGDIMRMKEIVIEVRLSNSRPESGIVNISNELYNQRDELVFSFDVAALVQTRPIS